MKWRTLRVSADGTHHVDANGEPAYVARFNEVLPFHDPGFAPVRRGSKAWHIGIDGEPAYARRFTRAFGFYEGLAAVADGAHWHHIRPDGQDAYPWRYQWCGNLQEGRCPVRDREGSYHHIDDAGQSVYASRWRYAGDFRGGIAVVQAADGRSTHINRDGTRLHDRWFNDLDVFHKRLARARDERGWTHVDLTGRPIYTRRFEAVEPFYNGQARVERADGGLEIIDEAGQTIVELRPARRSEFAELSSDLVGFWRTDAIASALEVGVFEALPATTADLATRLAVHEGRLGVLLHGLRELELVRRTGDVWEGTERGSLLRHDHPWTLSDAALEYAGPLRRLWARLPAALRDSDWEPPDVFGDVAADPLRTDAHHRMLRSYARHDYALVPEALRLRGDEKVLDIGAGVGVLAGMLLDRYPDLEVLALDRPEVVARMPVRAGLRGVAADLFEPWSVHVDVAILARVTHDWPNDDAVRILRNARGALPEGGRVFLIEMLASDDGAFGGLCGLHLLLAAGGSERTATEYGHLLRAASFDLVEVRAIAALPSVLVGVAR